MPRTTVDAMRTPSATHVLAAITALALSAAACSNGGNDAADTTVPTVATTASTTLPTTVATTQPAPTTAPPTDPPTTIATTTLAPTTTIDAEQALIKEIEADLNEGEQALLTATGEPSSPASPELLSEYFANDSLEFLLGVLDDLASGGFVTRPGRDVQSSVFVRSILESDGTTALVRTCRIDAGAIVVPPTSDAPEVVYNDLVVRYESEVDVVRANDRWKQRAGSTLERIEGATKCGE